MILYISYKEFRPEIKKEIIQRINHHLNNKANDIYRLLINEVKYDRFEEITSGIFQASKEVVYVKVYNKVTKKWFRYYGGISRNEIYYKSELDDTRWYHLKVHKYLRNKWVKVKDRKKIISMAKSLTNNTREAELPLYKKFDVKEFFKTEEERYVKATNKIHSMMKLLEKEKEKLKDKKLKKISQPLLYYKAVVLVKSLIKATNTYNDKIKFILSKAEKNKVAKYMRGELKEVMEEDFKKLSKRAFPKKRSREKRDLYTWQIINLKRINKIIRDILSRMTFVNTLVKKTPHFFEGEISMSKNTKVKNMDVHENIKIIKLYKAVMKKGRIYGVIEAGISEKEITSRIDPIIRKGLLSSLVFVVISIISGLLLALYLIFPIHTLNKGAAALLRDKSFRIKLKRKDEFGNLANTMNYLSEELTAELKKYESLYKDATEDELTKLMVRRYFMETLKTELKNAGKEKRPTSLFMTDIDHFKKFNDTYGHQTGDLVLTAVAAVLLKNTRSSGIRMDIAGRYGGEEFVILLPDTDKEIALKIAERVRKDIEEMVVKSDEGKDLRVKISIGVHTSEDSSVTSEEIIKKADTALYQSKENGRNRVTFV